MEEEGDLFAPQLLGQLPDLHYIAKLSGERSSKAACRCCVHHSIPARLDHAAQFTTQPFDLAAWKSFWLPALCQIAGHETFRLPEDQMLIAYFGVEKGRWKFPPDQPKMV